MFYLDALLCRRVEGRQVVCVYVPLVVTHLATIILTSTYATLSKFRNLVHFSMWVGLFESSNYKAELSCLFM